jgi:DNA processing protein
MGIPVFAVPAAPWDVRGLGFQELLRQGAQICNSADDVLKGDNSARREIRRRRRKTDEKQESFQGFASHEREVLEALSNRPVHPDELSIRTGIGAAELQRTILKLQMQGHIESRAGGKYCRTLPGFALRHEEIDEQSSPNR